MGGDEDLEIRIQILSRIQAIKGKTGMGLE